MNGAHRRRYKFLVPGMYGVDETKGPNPIWKVIEGKEFGGKV